MYWQFHYQDREHHVLLSSYTFATAKLVLPEVRAAASHLFTAKLDRKSNIACAL